MATVNSNIAAKYALNNLNKTDRDLTSAMERLSSGKRINHAGDDAAGAAISDRMTSQIKGLEQYIEAGLALRAEAGIKVRQPLPEIALKKMLDDELLVLLADRINVKEISECDSLPEGSEWVRSAQAGVALNTKIASELQIQ